MQNNSQTKSAVELAYIHSSHDNTTPSIPTTDGYRLNPSHYQEWLNSSVDKDLIEANEIFSIDGDKVYDYLLAFHEAQRRNDGRLSNADLARHDHCRDGGWWFGSVNVRTGEHTSYGCFKPDNPRENPENGKTIKYEAPLGSTPQLFAFHVPPSIWKKISERYLVPIGVYTNIYKWVIDHPQIPLFLTEGAKKVACLLSMGYFAVGVSGVTHCYKTDKETGSRTLHPDIEYLCNGNRHLYFGFDCDANSKTRKTVHNIIRKTAGLIKEYNPNTQVFKVTWNGAKGVDDWLALNSPDRFNTQVKRAKIVMPIAPDYEESTPNYPNRKSGETAQKLNHIRQSYPSLKFNELTQQVEFNGEAFQRIELAYLDDAIIHSPIHIGKEFCQDAILKVALENSYHPIKDYLDELEAQTLSKQEWDNISSLLLGTDDPLSNAILKRCLIACVARIYHPGCINRLVTILTGKQRSGKSTFWRYLAGDEFFSDSLGSLHNIKDDYLALHSSWIMEWGEFDKITRKREADEIKAFVTKCFDDFRPPYGRNTERFKRMQVIVGTTNRTDFLKNDPSGNTRYGVIEVNNEIDLDKVLALRDRVWATAKQAYLNGEPWELTRDEQALSEANNRAYEEQHPWMEAISKYIEPFQTITTNEIFAQCLEIDLSRRTIVENRIVCDILRKLGWKQDKNPTKTNYGRCRVWRHTHTVENVDVCQSTCIAETHSPPDLQGKKHSYTVENQANKKVCQSSTTNNNPIETTSKDNIESVVVNLDAPSNKKNPETQEASDTPVVESDESIDYQELIAEIDAEMERLGWSANKGVDYIQKHYGVKSRVKLNDIQLIEFSNYLKTQTN